MTWSRWGEGKVRSGIRIFARRPARRPDSRAWIAAQRLERGLLQFHGLDAELHHVEAHLQPAFDDPELADLPLQLRGVERGKHRRGIRKRHAGGGPAKAGPSPAPSAAPRNAEPRNRHAQRIPHLLHELRDVLEGAAGIVFLAVCHVRTSLCVCGSAVDAAQPWCRRLPFAYRYRVCRASYCAASGPSLATTGSVRSRKPRDQGQSEPHLGHFCQTMSIYRRTDRVPLNDVAVHGGAARRRPSSRKTTRTGAKRRACGAGQRPPPAHDQLGVEPASATSVPNALLAKFPRIANLLAVLWEDPNSLRRYLDDLLVDKRGNRQGFPLDILRELFALARLLRPIASRNLPGRGRS